MKVYIGIVSLQMHLQKYTNTNEILMLPNTPGMTNKPREDYGKNTFLAFSKIVKIIKFDFDTGIEHENLKYSRDLHTKKVYVC